MKTTSKHKLANNPLYFQNQRTAALDEALRVFLETFDEYAEQHELTEMQISSFRQLIMDYYIERRARYFIEHKFFTFNDYINQSIDNALKRSTDNTDREHVTRLFFYNNKHNLIENEH